MAQLLDCMVSVVNRDDVVPRLTVQNVQGLAKFISCPGQVAKTKAWLDEDWKAMKDLERVVDNRRRHPAKGAGSQGSGADKVGVLLDAGIGREAAERALEQSQGDVAMALFYATEEEHDRPSAPPDEDKWQRAKEKTGKVLEETGQHLVSGWQKLSEAASEQIQTWSASSSEEVVIAREDHTQFYIPGQVIHIYRENGLARPALAASTHDAFAGIQPSLSMLDDHMLKDYDETVRQACISEPKCKRWETSEDRSTCACCEAEFHWAYVLQSEPQRMLARNHCFSCGRLVCSGCSENQQAFPSLGFSVPVRTCDTCFYNPDDEL